MPNITYIDVEGAERTIDVPEGHSVMEGAINNDIPGIDANCGGTCVCATCHVYVAQEWLGRLQPPEETEGDILEAIDSRETSRLACQIIVTPALDGLRVTTPREQG